MPFRSLNPGLYRIVQYHPDLVAFLSSRSGFRDHAASIARVRRDIESLNEWLGSLARREHQAADAVVSRVLDDAAHDSNDVSRPVELPDLAALDTTESETAVRLLTTVEHKLVAGIEAVIQDSLDDVFEFLHGKVAAAVERVRWGEGDAQARGSYAESRAVQRTLLRQIGFGLGDWRSAAIVRNVDDFWPEWRRYRRAGTAQAAQRSSEAALPPWPFDDLDAQLQWLIDHPAAKAWVPTPTELEDHLEKA